MLTTQNRIMELPIMEVETAYNLNIDWSQLNRANDILSIDYYIYQGRLSDQIHTIDETTGGLFIMPRQEIEYRVLKKKLESFILIFFARIQDDGKCFSSENKLSFTIGKFFDGIYKDKQENTFSKASLGIEIKGVEDTFLIQFGAYLTESMGFYEILYKSYNGSSKLIHK